MSQPKGLLLVLCFGFLLSSCAINVLMPSSRMESPEATGEGKVKVSPLDLQGASRVILSPDYQTFPVDLDHPQLTRKYNSYRMGAGMGITDELDLDLKVQIDTPVMVQGKYQLLGQPRTEAEKENLSLAATLALSVPVSRDHTSGEGLLTTTNVSTNNMVYDGSVIGGYRFLDEWLVYGGPSYTYYSISGTREVKYGQSRLNVQEFSGSAMTPGVHSGVQYATDIWDLKFELSYQRASCGQVTLNGIYYGLRVGFVF